MEILQNVDFEIDLQTDNKFVITYDKGLATFLKFINIPIMFIVLYLVQGLLTFYGRIFIDDINL